MTVNCQLHEAGWRLSVGYIRQDDGYLWQAGGLYVNHRRQDDSYLLDAWGRFAFICQLHGTG
jgi:hypothetical protein